MPTLITGDLHSSDNPRDSYRDKIVPWLIKRIKELKVNDFIILGDLTVEKNNHSEALVNKVVDSIANLAAHCKVTIIMGNHDYEHEDNPFFRFLDHIQNVDWYGIPTETDFSDLGSTLILPHTRDYKRDWKDLPAYDCVLTHVTFEGADSGTGKLSGVPISTMKNQKLVISGDVHVPQEIKNVIYVGAPYTINFGDSYEGRVMLMDEGSISFIKVDLPQKRLVEVSSINKLIEEAYAFSKGDVVRVKFNLEQADDWRDIKARIKAITDQYEVSVEIVPSTRTLVKSFNKTDLKTDKELIEHYAERIGVSSKRGLSLAKRAPA